MPSLHRSIAWTVALLAGLAPARAFADLDPRDGVPITTSDYTIDLYQGPVFSGSRVTALAGAYAPIAEGVAGYSYNPAAAALRVPWSVDWFDWDLDGGFSFPAAITTTDFDNNGDESYANSAAFFATGGGGLQFGALGIGLTLDWSRYQVKAIDGSGTTLNVNLIEPLLVAAYSFFHGDLLLGVGVSLHNVNIARPKSEGLTLEETQITSVTGPALRAGAIWAPHKLPLRASAAVRWSPISSQQSTPQGIMPDENGNFISQGYYLPRTVSLPTEINAGVAFQFFRRFNFRFTNPHKDPASLALAESRAATIARAERRAEAARKIAEAEKTGQPTTELRTTLDAEDRRAEAEAQKRLAAAKKADHERLMTPYRVMTRRKLLVSLAVKATTITRNGVGLESFLKQEIAHSGEELSLSPRLGVESEIIPGYLVVRGGSYYEPTRFRTSSARVHGTFGLDVRIPVAWSVFGLLDPGTTFRVSGALDGSARYFGWSVGAGIWH